MILSLREILKHQSHIPQTNQMFSIFQNFSFLSLICTIIVSLFLLLFFSEWIVHKGAKKNVKISKPQPPEAAGAWPIIGHLHLFAGKLLPHRLLAKMADKHGPIFYIRNGVQKALVISSWEMAKECFHSNDKSLTSRPRLTVIELMAYGQANIFLAPFGPYWRSLRKIVSLELLSNNRLDKLSYIWEEEVNVCINNLCGFWLKNKKSGSNVVLVDLKEWFSQLSMSIILKIVAGKSFVGCKEEVLHLQHTMEEVFQRLGSFVIADALPFLRWLDLGGQEKSMKKIGREMDDILQSWLQEHKKKRLSGNTDTNDFIDVMLSILNDHLCVIKNSDYDVDTIIKATCMAMLVGASDTSSVFLTWAISLLLNNRHVLKKAQDELDIHVGKERRVLESDVPNLVYLQAIVKETLRTYPPAPLSAPREFNEDCDIGGYHIEKGTRLIVNLSKIQCDSQVWDEPMEFRPERFLTTHKDVDVRGRSFEVMPFGCGRRMCPGMLFGLRNAHFLLASFLQAFEFSTVDDSSIDMTEGFGLTNLKATPLDVFVAPRLFVDLYK